LGKAHPFATELSNIDFDVHAGEVLGVAGVSGNGQQELLAVLSGEDTRVDPNAVWLDGQAVGHRSAAWRRARGMAFVPEERLGRAAVPELSLAQNVLLSHQDGATVRRGFVRQRSISRLAVDIIERFRIKATGPQAQAGSLSGG